MSGLRCSFGAGEAQGEGAEDDRRKKAGNVT